MIRMIPGYNLVERRLLRKEFEEIEERMSIIEFLRRTLIVIIFMFFT